MSLEANLATWELTKKQVTSTEKLLLLSLARRCGEEHSCWPSVKRMSEDTGLDRKYIISSRQKLIEKGLLRFTGEMRGRCGQIPVMKLLYVDEWEQKRNSPRLQDEIETLDNKDFTSTQSGTGKTFTSTQSGTGTSTQSGTLNNKEEKVNNNISAKQNVCSKKSEELSLEDMKKNNPHEIPEQMLLDWLAVRKQKKAKVTQTAWNKINKELDKCKELGIDPTEAFETMVASGWQSMKVEYFMTKEHASKREASQKLSIELEEMAKRQKERAIEDSKRLNRVISEASQRERAKLRNLVGIRVSPTN